MQAQYYVRRLAGYRVETSPETGDKAERAAPVAAQCNVGNLSLVAAPWNRAFLPRMVLYDRAIFSSMRSNRLRAEMAALERA
jgi:phage terminase large subunit-like protein